MRRREGDREMGEGGSGSEGGREGRKEGGREGGKEGGKEGGREEGGREVCREGGKERGRRGWIEIQTALYNCIQHKISFPDRGME